MWLLLHGIFLMSLFLTGMIFFVYPFSVRVISAGRSLKRDSKTPELTVIVPVYNEEATIQRKVENLRSSDYPMEKVRILVVDNGSTDRTMEIARDLSVETLQTPRGKVHAINQGLQEARTDCIVVTDADVLLEKEALRRAVSLLGDDVGAVSGMPCVRTEQSRRKRNQEKRTQGEFLLRHQESLLHSACSLDGKLMVFSAEMVGQFPPETRADDYELTFLTIQKGKRAVVDIEARVYEERSGDFGSEIQRVRRWFKQGFLTSWRYRNVLWDRRYGFFGSWTFPFRRFFIYYIPLYFFLFFLYALFVFKAWIVIPVCLLGAVLLLRRDEYPLVLFVGILLSWYDLVLFWRKKHAYLMGTWEH